MPDGFPDFFPGFTRQLSVRQTQAIGVNFQIIILLLA